jgi:hypothetical protein
MDLSTPLSVAFFTAQVMVYAAFVHIHPLPGGPMLEASQVYVPFRFRFLTVPEDFLYRYYDVFLKALHTAAAGQP